jgi:hypothetical protein
MQFEYEEALYRTGQLRGEDLPAIASRMIEAGFDAPAVCELASMRSPTLRDSAQLFEQALASLGRARLTEDRAWLLVREGLLRAVARGEMEPFEGAAKLHLLWIDLKYPTDLSIFVGLEDEASEHPEARSEIAGEIQAHATRLLQQSLRSPSA